MNSYRALFDGIETLMPLENGHEIVPINFDNGATTPPLKCVNLAIAENMLKYGPISRGTGQKGDYCTTKFDQSRQRILKFFGVAYNPNYSVVYVKNATEGMNLLATILPTKQTDKILVTRMEHHSNDLPWRNKMEVVYLDTDHLGRISLEKVEEKLKSYRGGIKYLSVTGASNVTGYITPIQQLAKLCHKYGAKIIVDAAQLVAHRQVDMQGVEGDDSIDFLVFSGHKAYAPYGVGAVVGKFYELGRRNPMMWGGGMVDKVSDAQATLGSVPECYEAGTQNFLGIMGLVEALDALSKIGYDAIISHESALRDYLLDEMKKNNKIILYGDTDHRSSRLGVIPFNIRGISCEEVATILANRYGIATRFGKFCAHPYVERILTRSDVPLNDTPDYYGEYGMVRISLGLYNTEEEARRFLKAIAEIMEEKSEK